MTEDQLREKLAEWDGQFGRQHEAARALGISAPFFCQMLNGKRPLNPAALNLLGYKKTICFEPKESA